MDLSPLLPTKFEHIDAANEGASNSDLGLGPTFSEVELFLSEEPFEMIYGFLTIVESRIDRASTDAILKDEQQITSLIEASINAGLVQKGLEPGEVEIRITYPDLGDLAVSGEGHIATMGITVGFDILWFRSNEVYIFFYSSYFGAEKQSLLPIGREIEHRIEMFSQ